MDGVYAEHRYNPVNGFYEPISRTPPLNANLVTPLVAGNLIVGIVAANPVWIYMVTLANTGGAVETVTLTEPGGNTYILQIPGNTTLVVQSPTPDQPLLMSTAAGNLTLVGTVGAATFCTVAYYVK